MIMANGIAMQQQKLQQVRDAAAKYLPATAELQLAGQSVKVPDLLSVLDAALASYAPATAARSALKQAQTDRTQKVASAHQEVAQLKAYLLATWGKGNPQLAPFGFEPRARTPLTSEQLALKTAKAKLTRTARGTKGSKQKLAVTAQGRPGLVLVSASGTPMPGVLKGPTAPGSGNAPATQVLAPVVSGPAEK
jgi:hypothetical protein